MQAGALAHSARNKTPITCSCLSVMQLTWEIFVAMLKLGRCRFHYASELKAPAQVQLHLAVCMHAYHGCDG
jgi:hypothetical protein